MSRPLEQAGVRVRLTRSVEEALQAYTLRPPAVLVSDIGMPARDGYSLIRVIRDREAGTGRRTLAIAMTGFASRLDHEAALLAGSTSMSSVQPAEVPHRCRFCMGF